MILRKKPQNWLEDVIRHWDDGTPWTVREVLRGLEVKGITGSGKSSGPRDTLSLDLLRHPKSVFYIVGQKPEDRTDMISMFKEAKKPLIVMEEGSDHRCNYIDDEQKAGADDRALVEFIMIMGDALQGGEGGGGRDNEKYWRLLEERIIYNALVALRLGTGKIGLPEMQRFISTAAYSIEQMSQAKWKMESFHYKTMVAADESQKSRRDSFDFVNAVDFWNNEFIHMDDKPRTSVLAAVMNTMFNANSGLVRETSSTDTTFSPGAALDSGISIYQHYPFADYGPSGRYLVGGLKYKIQKHILRRKVKPGDFFIVNLFDEFQEVYTRFDAPFMARCRSNYGCMFTLTQTTHSELASAGGGHASHHKIGALKGNYGYHMYCQSDLDTSKEAVGHLGQQREPFISLSPGNPVSLYEELMGRSQVSASVTESYQPVLQTTALNNLRSGGPGNNFMVDTLLIRTGQPFYNGKNYQFVSFKQR